MKLFFLIIGLFLLNTFVSVAQTTDTYTSSGTWICPAGVTTATVECWGAGGGGATMSGAGKGGGGGGGAYSSSVVTVVPGNNYSITVGTGGNAGINGGNSSFSTLVIAVGGSGVPTNNSNGGNGGLASASTGTTRNDGGNGGTGSASSGGGGGGAGSTGAGGAGGDGTAGTGTPNNGGDGGVGVGGNTNGNPGNVYGGGGSGASRSGGANRTGGSGANGLVTITYSVAVPKCPSSTTIAPSATQTLCQNASSNQLTATVTYSGNTGTPTLQYQWYYNNTNSNTVAGATVITGATSATYSPPTTTVGTRYYFCVCYSADNGCSQTATTQSLASNVVQVTINSLPTAVTVSGGGTFCGSTTLSASGGTGGTIYWQNTTSNGTSTTTPSSSQVVSATGTYYFRAQTASGCWGTQGSATVTINANPTITLGADPTVCKGTTTSDQTYSGITGSANQYSIDYDVTAQGQGFVDVVNAALPASPIVLTVPAGANAGIYNYTVSVRNSATGCVSGTYAKTIEVLNPAPVQPGVISGTANVSPATPGLVYSISAVTYATTYTWSVPVGWSITAGQGTTTMTCTSGALGQNGNISVTAGNSCGTSSASTLAVQVVDLPTITLGTSPTVCQGTTTADLTYSATTGSPNRYTIDWDITAEGQGFVDVAYTNLPASPIVLVVPGAAVTGTYNGVLKVKNQAAGIESLGYNISVTIITTPSVPGAISGSPTVAPATPGYVYSISSVLDATSYTWTVPAGWTITAGQGTISMTTTSGNVGEDGNITVTATNSCGTSAAQTFAVTVQAAALPPTITLGTNPTVCKGTTSANITYSATTNSPDQYSINYNSAANTAGFVDVTNAVLPVSPIVLVVPVAPAIGTYYGSLTVKNSSTGAVSQNYIISVTIIDVPAVPDAISGQATANQNTSYSYSVASVLSATSYTWTVPSGWVINSGQGTNSVSVTSGNAGQNGNITVTASNSCGTSGASIKAVTSVAPSDHVNYTCNGCHLTHTAPGVTLTNTLGNALLCQSCHSSGQAASGKAISDAMKATPGVGGTSHNWGVAAINGSVEAVVPTIQDMADRLDGGNIVCSTCHNQHNPNTYGKYLRASNTGDALCKNCHSARNIGRWVDNNVTNKGSHPVGLTYNGGSESLLGSPTAPLQTVSGKIECSSCHQTHFSTSTNGYLLRTTDANSGDVLCTSCHSYGSHNLQGCKVCHYTHSTNKNNIYLIRNTIATPNSGNKTVVFTSDAAGSNFADGVSQYDGVCEVCHTATAHYKNDGTGSAHYTSVCTGCHTHSNNFTPAGGGCDGCHNAINTPTVGIYTTDAHSTHVTRYGYACSTCHFGQGMGGSSEPTHPSGGTGEVTFDPNGLATRNGQDVAPAAWAPPSPPAYDLGTRTCTNVYCHSNGQTATRGSDVTDDWSGFTAAQLTTRKSQRVYATTLSWYTGQINACTDCHGGKGNMTSPYTIVSADVNNAGSANRPNTGSHQVNAHIGADDIVCSPVWGGGTGYTQCFWCHNTSTSPTPDCGTNLQGTYGSSFHVDGQTYFTPRLKSAGGTMANGVIHSASANHCGASKACW